LRDPNLLKKAINYTLDKARPVFQKVASEMLDQISTKVQPNRRHKTDRPDLDGAGIDIHSAMENSPNQNGVGRYWAIIIPGHIIPLNSRQTTIQKRVKLSKYINNQRGQQTRLQ